jgi:hypothetical protein
MSRLVFLSIAIVLSLLPVVAPAAPAHNRLAPRWHGYGFLPGYHQPPNNSLPAYAQKASVSRMARRNQRPWYIDPIMGTMATGTISAGLAFTVVATTGQLWPLLDGTPIGPI